MSDIMDAWLEWREKCAVDKCSDQHAHELCKACNDKIKLLDYLLDIREKYDPNKDEEQDSERKNAHRINSERYYFRRIECEMLPKKFYDNEERRIWKDKIFARANRGSHSLNYYFFYWVPRSFFKKKKEQSINTYESNLSITAEKDMNDDDIMDYNIKKSIDPGIINRKLHQDCQDPFLNQLAQNFFDGLNDVEKVSLFLYSEHFVMSDVDILNIVKLGKSAFCAKPTQLMNSLYKILSTEYCFEEDDMRPLIFTIYSLLNIWSTKSDFCKEILKVAKKNTKKKTKKKKENE